MKEQVVASRGARRPQPKGFAQRPARRDGSGASRTDFSPRALFAYVPKAFKFVSALVILIAAIVGYRVAASASLFQLRSVDVTGTSRTSADEIAGLTRRAVMRTGVWRADLAAISNDLSKLPGVRSAVVSRVLPDGLRVRVTERVPAAVVRNSAGHFVWVDDEGIQLGEMKADDQMPAFFIRGWSEDGTEESRQENAQRVKKYQELVREWSALGLSERVSEVTLIDLRDVRVQLAGNDAQVEVRLGSQEQGQRLKIALEALDLYKQGARGAITYVNVQTGRVTIGRASNNKLSDANGDSQQPADSDRSQASIKNNDSGVSKDRQSPKTNSNANREKKNEAIKGSPAPGLRFR